MRRYPADAVLALATALSLCAALPAVSAAGPDRAATGLRVMPLGDSITWGVGSGGGSGYRSFLSDRLTCGGYAPDFVGGGRHGDMADPDNEGHTGWRIDQVATVADAAAARYRPDVITLEIGTNDLYQNHQVATAADRLSALIDGLTRAAPDATVLVGSLIVSTNATEEAARPAFNRRIPGIVRAEQAAGRRVRLVDLGSLNAGDLSDALHPADSGYRKIADAFDLGIRAASGAGWIKAPAVIGAAVRSGPREADLRTTGSAQALDLTAGAVEAAAGGVADLRDDMAGARDADVDSPAAPGRPARAAARPVRSR
jgi:lysophospholipase L1-like esterase